MRKIKEEIQFQQNDCGPCCLSMILNYYDYQITVPELSSQLSKKNGWSMLDLKTVVAKYYLQSNVFKITDLKGFDKLQCPLVLFWESSHFVVLESISENIVIVDPSIGHVKLNRNEFNQKFSGFAMSFVKNEHFQKRKLSKLRYVKEFNKAEVWSLNFSKKYLLLLLIYNMLLFLAPVVISLFISDLQKSKAYNLIWLALLLFVVAIVVFLLEREKASAVLKLERDSTYKIYQKIMFQKDSTLSKYHSGDILTRIFSNSEICRFISIDLPNIVSSVILFTTVSVYLVYRIGHLSIFLIFFVLSIGILNGIFVKPLIGLSKKEGYKLSDFRSVSNDGITSHGYLFNSGAIKNYLNKFLNSLSSYIQFSDEKNKFEALATTAQQASNLFFSMLISLLGLSLVILFPKSSGNVSLLMSSGMILVTPVMSVVSSIVNFAVSYPSFIRLVELINSLEHVSDEQIMENGEIEISNLSFKYPEMKYNIFHNFTVKISQGEQVIITGASGTGKTTLINLILGLEEEYEGEVIVGGVNTKLSNLDLRKDVCYISQPSKLFKGTLKENLELYLDSYHYDELVKLSDKIGLSELMNDISNFENILLLEDGRNFSLGQRQRLTLLRAFLGKYKLVIFDEPTSNLDFSHAKKIFSLIEKIDATKIIITHDKQFLDSSQTIIDLGGQNGYKIMQY